MDIKLKRVYEEPASDDGFRVLVDRLWPRGLSKQKAKIDLWDKDVAPSAELRKAFHHEDMPHKEFVAAYKKELRSAREAVDGLREQIAGHDVVTLLYSSHDEDHTHAPLLRDALRKE